mmetsp:Transcript_20171/g.20273  ORF Transcript_20171/g.20273 Transcript_20171/m.20273 type:complete len:398 (+) Transcript_20171:100-1293(+)
MLSGHLRCVIFLCGATLLHYGFVTRAFHLKPSLPVLTIERESVALSVQPVFMTPKEDAYSYPTSQNLRTEDVFTLESIRSSLIRQEETIIFALIERAQFKNNFVIYDCKKNNLNSVYGAPLSFLEWMLIETEKLHAKVRRYTSPDEYAFFPAYLPQPLLAKLQFPSLIPDKGAFDVNSEVFRWYVGHVIPQITLPGDDEQHGSSVLCDIAALQAISRRVHYGKFVAESKFLQDPELYTSLARAGDVLGMLKLLTNVEVEKAVLRRAFAKASTYGQDPYGQQEGFKVNPMIIAELYRDMIIPLTKDVEIRYLFQRVGIQSPSPDTYYESCRGPMNAFDDLYDRYEAATAAVATAVSDHRQQLVTDEDASHDDEKENYNHLNDFEASFDSDTDDSFKNH